MRIRRLNGSISPVTVVLALGLVAALATGVAAYRNATDEALEKVHKRQQLLVDLRKSSLKLHLYTIRTELVFWALDEGVREAFKAFSSAWRQLGESAGSTLRRLYIDENPYPAGERQKLSDAKDGSEYSRVHARYHSRILRFLEYRGYYDVFLFDTQGNLLYTIVKENDFATNMVTGAWRDSGLGKAFRAARDGAEILYIAFSDIAPYMPSEGVPASFIASPVFDEDDRLIGVLALQIPIEPINEIMHYSAGMGGTGETYIVGDDRLMRSQSRFIESPTILRTTVDTVTVGKALAGETGVQITPDYRGIPVLSAYAPLQFHGVTWAIMAEMDEAEVMEPVSRMRTKFIVALGVVLLVLSTAGAIFIYSKRRIRVGEQV